MRMAMLLETAVFDQDNEYVGGKERACNSEFIR